MTLNLEYMSALYINFEHQLLAVLHNLHNMTKMLFMFVLDLFKICLKVDPNVKWAILLKQLFIKN